LCGNYQRYYYSLRRCLIQGKYCRLISWFWLPIHAHIPTIYGSHLDLTCCQPLLLSLFDRYSKLAITTRTTIHPWLHPITSRLAISHNGSELPSINRIFFSTERILFRHIFRSRYPDDISQPSGPKVRASLSHWPEVFVFGW
jgi:hypothetical protein